MRAELRRILLVEDDPRDAELTQAALEAVPLANPVDCVADGEEALAYLFRRGPFAGRESGMPAVVLLDLKLPKIDGLEVLRAIRADEQLRPIPVVMLTSSRDERDLLRSYQLGVNAFVVKPVDFAEFAEAVRRVGLFWAVLNEPPPHARRAA
jgi:CheY-like chemotaxis protein